MFSPQQRQDKIVRATDLDALSCRYYATKRGYLADEYIDSMVDANKRFLHLTPGYTMMSSRRLLKTYFEQPKLPLINRGTYIRTRSVDMVMDSFLGQYDTCQVVSLGSGSDTRAFKILSQPTYQDRVVYHEIDFPSSTKIKTLAINNDEKLRKIIYRDVEPETEPYVANSFKNEAETERIFKESPSEIHTKNYHLHGVDLREISANMEGAKSVRAKLQLDSNLPTLILSECVLCYLAPEHIIPILTLFRDNLTAGVGYLIYEPMSNNDSFGQVMQANLSSRGISLPSFELFPTIQAREKFLREAVNFTNIRLSNMTSIMKHWVNSAELNRINRLEILDELEEINLLNDHYVLCYAESGELKLQLQTEFP